LCIVTWYAFDIKFTHNVALKIREITMANNLQRAECFEIIRASEIRKKRT